MKRLIENILKKSNSGFTMIELSIVILVMAIFGTLTAEILSNATKIYSESLKRQQFISEARSSFFKISRELSWQKHFEGFKQSSEKRIFINTGDGNSISYEIRNSNDILNFNNQLSTDLLSKKINYNTSSFSFYNSDYAPIDLTNQNHEVMIINMNLNYVDNDLSINFNSDISPYSLSLGRAMSYHE